MDSISDDRPDGVKLLPQHLADLRRSGLSDEQIALCGFYSEVDPARIAKLLGWDRPATDLGSCLSIPFFGRDGQQLEYIRIKPDQPRTSKKKPVKYESPRGQANRVYLPPFTRSVLADPHVPLFVVEGEKKAAKADQEGFACLGLVGVYGWHKKRPKGSAKKGVGPRILIPDLASINWNGRRVYIVFDSDAATNPNVRRAETLLAAALRKAGAKVVIVRLAAGPADAKQGLDDFLVASGVEAFRALIATTERQAESVNDRGASLFRDDEKLDRLAILKLDDPALYAAERADLKKLGVSLRDLDKALEPRIAQILNARQTTAGASRQESPYFIRGGITYRTVGGRDGPVDIALCNFAATIATDTTRDDGVEQSHIFTIRGQTSGGTLLPLIAVPATEFAGMAWVQNWGNRAIVYAGQGAKDHLRTAIQILSGEVCEQTVYSHLGWREVSGQWMRLHAGGAIGAEGPVSGVEVAVDPLLARFLLSAPPTGDELIGAVRVGFQLLDVNTPLASDRVLIPILGALYRSLLGGTIDFGLHLFGRTGTFKSELAALVQQHLGPEMDSRHFPANWSFTANALEGIAFAAKDCLLVIDDFNPTGALDPQKLHATADRVFRGVGNGAGRGRMNADLSLRPERPPRGVILSTGEDVPRGHSLRARSLVVEIKDKEVSTAVLTQCQAHAAGGRYAAATAGFVQWLAGRYGEIQGSLQTERARARDSFAKSTTHARTPAAVGDLMLGWDYCTLFAVEIGAITDSQRQKILARVRAALVEVSEAQAEFHQAADPVDQFLHLIPSVLAGGAAHLENLSGGYPNQGELFGWQESGGGSEEDSPTWRARGNRIGWVDEEFLYLLPDVAFGEVQRMAASHRDPITMTLQTLVTRLHERKLLAAVDNRGGKVRFKIRLTFAGVRVDVLKFCRSTFYPVRESGPSGPKGAEAQKPSTDDWATPGATDADVTDVWPSEWPTESAGNAAGNNGVGHLGHSTADATMVEGEI